MKKWSVYGGQCKNCMCVRMDGGWEGGSNDWEKCSGSRFCATVILSLSLSLSEPLSIVQASDTLYSNYPDWVSWG